MLIGRAPLHAEVAAVRRGDRCTPLCDARCGPRDLCVDRGSPPMPRPPAWLRPCLAGRRSEHEEDAAMEADGRSVRVSRRERDGDGEPVVRADDPMTRGDLRRLRRSRPAQAHPGAVPPRAAPAICRSAYAVVGVSRTPMTDEAYRDAMRAVLQERVGERRSPPTTSRAGAALSGRRRRRRGVLRGAERARRGRSSASTTCPATGSSISRWRRRSSRSSSSSSPPPG